MNILLLYPEDKAIKEFMSERPPLGLAYIAASLESAGYKPAIVDLNLEVFPVNELKKYDAIGISFLTPFYVSVQKLVRDIRQINKNAFIFVGGYHPSIMPHEVLKENDIDAVVMGEGDLTIVELIKSLENKKPLNKVKGISYKKDGKIYHNESRPLINDLGVLPLPARHLLKMDRYVNYIFNERCTTIITSRGCPYRCVYCAQIYKSWRPRSPKDVVDEIEAVQKEYGINNFYFYDDLVTLNKQRVIDICKEIINRKIKIKWICTARVDTVNPEMLKWMKASGCESVHYGVESGDPEILKKIKKGITLEQVRNAFRWTKQAGISSKAYFMMGFPFEKRENIERTIKFSLTIDTDELQYLILVPYPGTEMWDYAIENGIIDPKNVDWEEFRLVTLGFKRKVFFTNNLSQSEMISLRKKAYRKAITHMVFKKIREGDIKYIRNLIKEKKNLGLTKFLKSLLFSR